MLALAHWRPGDAVSAVPAREPTPGKVLSGVRHTAGPAMPELRDPAPRFRQVLRRVCTSCRHRPDRARADGGAGSVLVPRGLHARAPRREDPHLAERP